MNLRSKRYGKQGEKIAMTLLARPGIADWLWNVFVYLEDPEILLQGAIVCKVFWRSAVSPVLWQGRCLTLRASLPKSQNLPAMSYLQLYQNLIKCVWYSRNPNIILSADRRSVRTNSPAFGWRTVCTRGPAWTQEGKCSWRVRVGQLGLDDPYVCAGGRLIIGLVADHNGIDAATRLGEISSSYGYMSHDGQKVCEAQKYGAVYGPSYGVTDVIGILYDKTARTISFSKNDESLGIAFQDVVAEAVYPSVSVCFATATLLL